uniref:Matrin-type domain-containing protein n=1 Tax=Glossina brevipalpis TaxID=37001 RepID=A0A1A9WZV2_9MUSC
MNCDFLCTCSVPLKHNNEDKQVSLMSRSYEQRGDATNYEILLPTPAPPRCMDAAVYGQGSHAYYDDNTMISYVGSASNAAEACFKDRFTTSGKHDINCFPEIYGNAANRKNDAGSASIEKLSETSNEGKMVIFQGRDESYPDELNKLIHPMSCEVCNVKTNSLSSAKDHYESRVHDRRLTAWLNKIYVEKGLEAPSLKRFFKHGTAGPHSYYCKVCNLKLTSLAHANQHCAGRKHRLAISKLANSPDAGYYNSEDTSVSTVNKQNIKIANDGPYGTEDQFKISSSSSTNSNASTNIKPNQDTNTQLNSLLFCSMCSVTVTSALQMAAHLNGIKHKKKLQGPGAGSGTVINEGIIDKPVTACSQLQDNVLSTLLKTNSTITDSTDLSTYRTPNGLFYCKRFLIFDGGMLLTHSLTFIQASTY